MARYFFVFMLCCVAPFLSCTKKTTVVEKKSEKELSVTVSIVPQAYIVKRIAGERVKVNVMVPSNSSPETYEPGPKKMVELKDSAIYFSIGFPFEISWLKKLGSQFSSITIAKMHKNIPMRTFDGEEPHHHDHEHDHDHGHGDHHHDPHLWMDPVLLISLAENTLTELLKIDNANRNEYIQNHLKLKKELQVLHDELVDLFKDSKGGKFVVYHPAWGYFADRYGLDQVPVEVEGKEPAAGDMSEMIKFIKNKKVKKIFVHKQSLDGVAGSLVEDTGISEVVLDPLEENVVENIRKTAHQIKEGVVR